MVGMLWRRWRAADWHVETVIALIVATLNAAGAWVDDTSDAGAHGVVPAIVAAGTGAVLVVRRVLPLTTLGLVLAGLVTMTVSDHQVGSTPVALLFASHAAGRWARPVAGWCGLAGIWTVFAALALAGEEPFTSPLALFQPVVYAVPFAVGRYVTLQHAKADDDRDQVRMAERALVARELHDVVSHALTGISVQASSARHLCLSGPDATEAFARIETRSREALADLRRMLALVRDDAPASGAPSPGIHDLDDLVASHRATHGPVELHVDDRAGSVSPSAGVAVYRIVQESLTNVARHATGAPARVSVTTEPGAVVVRVEDDGVPVAPVRSGAPSHGLVGMAERVALFGGTLETGRRVGGGFGVVAVLPVDR